MASRIMKILALLVLLAAVIATMKFYFFRAPPSPEQQIMLSIARAEESAELGSVSGVMKVVSNDYADTTGSNKRDLSRLAVQALRGQQWQLSTQLKSLAVDGDTAEVDLQVAMWNEDAASYQLDYDITLIWRREGKTWRVVSSSGWHGYTDDEVGGAGPPGPY